MNLRPCPFCGSDKLHFSPAQAVMTRDGTTSPAVMIACMNCPAEMSVTDQEVTTEEVIGMWNARA